jgi:hypothetical protein
MQSDNPCLRNSQVKYCCPNCQEADWVTHSLICKCLPALMSDRYYGQVLAVVATAVVVLPLRMWELRFGQPKSTHYNSPFCKCDECWTRRGEDAEGREGPGVLTWTSGFTDLLAAELDGERDVYQVGRIAEVAESFLKVDNLVGQSNFAWNAM